MLNYTRDGGEAQKRFGARASATLEHAPAAHGRCWGMSPHLGAWSKRPRRRLSDPPVSRQRVSYELGGAMTRDSRPGCEKLFVPLACHYGVEVDAIGRHQPDS